MYSCAPPHHPICERNGKYYCTTKGLFLQEWDDYYERALSCIEGEFYDYAIADLKMAINMQFKDMRMVNTFGMHFIDYFPHRELGVIYFFQNKFQDAIQELELSISHELSAKGKYYLDKARKAKMKQDNIASSIPFLYLDQFINKNKMVTRDILINISGYADDSQYISEIFFSDKPIYLESTRKHTAFNQQLTLNEGIYDIDIKIRNLNGGENNRRVTIHVDRTGPVISIKEFEPGFKVQGTVYDESGEIVLSANGKQISIARGKEVPFEVIFKEKIKKIKLLAIDKPGNTTRAIFDNDFIFNQSQLRSFMIAQVAPDFSTDNGNYSINQKNSYNQIILYDLKDNQNVYIERIFVEGYVIARRDIAQLTINNKIISQKPSRVIFFNCPVSLYPGKNKVLLTAFNTSGQKITKEIILFRKIPSIFQDNHRYSSTQYVFKHGNSKRKHILFQYFLFNNFIKQNRLQVIVEKNLEKFFFDQKLNIETNGRFSDTQSSVLGTVYSTEKGIEIAARLTDNNRMIMSSGDVYSESKNISDLRTMSEKLSSRILNKIPILKGTITEIDEEMIIAKFDIAESCSNITINEGWPMIIYQQLTPESPWGSDTEILGYATMDKHLRNETYQFVITKQMENHIIQKGDRIVTQ